MGDVYCSCGGLTKLAELGRSTYRLCPSCGNKTKQVRTGRTTASEPKMQNIPIRTPEGRRIRDAFPRPKLELDYAEIELRIWNNWTGGGAYKTCLVHGNAFPCDQCE